MDHDIKSLISAQTQKMVENSKKELKMSQDAVAEMKESQQANMDELNKKLDQILRRIDL